MGRKDVSGVMGAKYQELGELRVRCRQLEAENKELKEENKRKQQSLSRVLHPEWRSH